MGNSQRPAWQCDDAGRWPGLRFAAGRGAGAGVAGRAFNRGRGAGGRHATVQGRTFLNSLRGRIGARIVLTGF